MAKKRNSPFQFGEPPPPADDRPSLPAGAAHLWAYFVELNDRRDYDPKIGAKLLTFQIIYYWCKLTGEKLKRWEIKALLKADVAYLTEIKAK